MTLCLLVSAERSPLRSPLNRKVKRLKKPRNLLMFVQSSQKRGCGQRKWSGEVDQELIHVQYSTPFPGTDSGESQTSFRVWDDGVGQLMNLYTSGVITELDTQLRVNIGMTIDEDRHPFEVERVMDNGCSQTPL